MIYCYVRYLQVGKLERKFQYSDSSFKLTSGPQRRMKVVQPEAIKLCTREFPNHETNHFSSYIHHHHIKKKQIVVEVSPSDKVESGIRLVGDSIPSNITNTKNTKS